MTKATTAEGDDIRRSFNWVTSRRGILKVTSDALICGNWMIPYETVDEAVLFQTRQCFITCYVLRIKAHGTIYQFGLNPGRFWKRELPFDVKREKMRLKYSVFSVAMRLVFVAALVYWLWTQCL
jgi:hypothetical protein